MSYMSCSTCHVLSFTRVPYITENRSQHCRQTRFLAIRCFSLLPDRKLHSNIRLLHTWDTDMYFCLVGYHKLLQITSNPHKFRAGKFKLWRPARVHKV